MSSSDKIKLGVLASGRGTNFQAIVEGCESGNCQAEVCLLITDRENAGALQIAAKHNIPAKTFLRKNYSGNIDFENEIVSALNSAGVELVCLAGFMRIVQETLLSAFPQRILNIHPSILPSFPGLNGQQQALDYGVKFTGCTVHFVNEGVDEGPIVCQAVVPVEENDTVEILTERILEQEHQIFIDSINIIAQNNYTIEGRRVRIKQ